MQIWYRVNRALPNNFFEEDKKISRQAGLTQQIFR